MSAIKRSESPGNSRRQKVGPLAQIESGGGGEQKRTEPVQAATTSPNRLVFGLNARANRMKHDEYAEQRLKNSSSIATTAKQVSSSELQSRKSVGHTSPSATNQTKSPLSASTSSDASGIKLQTNGLAPKTTAAKRETSGDQTAPRGTVRASKYGNFYKPQDLSSPSSMKPKETSDNTLQASASTTSNGKQQPAATTTVNKKVRARSKSPECNKSGSTGSSTKQMVRLKSIDEKNKGKQDVAKDKSISRANKHEIAGEQDKELASDNKEENSQQPVIKARTQFNILPPPQMAMATTGRGSVVSYAKSRIYDKPARPILSNPPTLFNTGNNEAISLVFSVGGEIPQAILSGRKPPKQVRVSQARKEWEGGEPFAKCRSRKRLAAAQRNKNKLLFHESWSMTSVVATQQLQLQQALAASNATHRSNIEQSDPSVKVLTRGSVLERVQQFERVPSSSSLSSGSISRSSSGSSLDSSIDNDPDGECELTIDTNSIQANSDEPRPLSPNAGKQAAYRYKVSTIQKQQQQSTFHESSISSSSSSVAATRKTSTSASSTNDANRRSSFRQRRLSTTIGKTRRSSSSLIPKFYHPQGTKPNTYEIEVEKRNIVACFEKFPDRKAQLVGPMVRRHFHSIALACSFSEYYKIPLLLYVKHLIETKPELFDEANLMACNGYGSAAMARRRSSLLPLNPNNVPNGNASHSSQRSLTRSSSQQISGDDAKISNKDKQQQQQSELVKNPLQKSASIDSGRDDQDNKNAIQYVSCEQFLACWKQLITSAYDTAARFTHLLTLGRRDYLLPDDFVPMVQSIIDDHPGLKFLRAAPDFHMRYIQTVIARIYFCVNKSWTGKIKLHELRRSNLLAVIQVLAQEEDINQITDYFSYEHFYVIYCKFWNLDQDHDLLISKEDLARHNDASISSSIIERIFLGIVSKQIAQSGKMSYSDFVWFLIAEEDKKHPRSIEYWFRLMDLDGDGYISMYELEYFYYEQMKRLELMNIEALPFLDTACQILDLVNPKEKNKISLADLKRTKMATIFFDTFINLEKYLEHESREFVSTRDVVQDGVIISDWDRYASEEYENMVTEETTI